MNLRGPLVSAAIASVLSASVSFSSAQQPTPPPPTPVPTPAPNIDLRMLRLKISAGDLPSAESILEYHEAEVGRDGDYTFGVAWLARGAALLGDWKSARKWAKEARAIAVPSA